MSPRTKSGPSTNTLCLVICAEVNLASELAHVAALENVAETDVIQAVEKAGYEAKLADIEAGGRDEEDLKAQASRRGTASSSRTPRRSRSPTGLTPSPSTRPTP